MLSISRQCELLGLSRASYYYRSERDDRYNQRLMNLIDEQFTRLPFYGVERMTAWLNRQGHSVNVKRIRRLMRRMGLEAIYPKPRLSLSSQEHKRYPYLLSELIIDRPNQVWCAHITYIRMLYGFIYLVVYYDHKFKLGGNYEVIIMTKKGGFHEERIKKLTKICDYQWERWIYRGQRDSKEGLETTLERACANYGLLPKDAKRIEDRLLREFQRKYHHYSQHIPDSGNALEWLSIMRHYGAPSRLLDFTYSFYVAAYFALEEAKNDCAVWGINVDWAVEKSEAKFTKGTVAWRFLNEFITDEKEKVFRKVFMGADHRKFACPQNPFRLNERLTIQKGAFMCPGDVTSSFEENLRSLPGWDKRQNIVKIIIPQRFKKGILDIFDGMNISRVTLFPGLDGFAKSLNILPPKGWDDSR